MDFYSKATKHPDRMTVKVAAVTLMMVNKTTTTLEVKSFLRHQGYIAYQEDISEMMICSAREEGWLCFYNGKFRVYLLGEAKEEETMVENDLLGFSSN